MKICKLSQRVVSGVLLTSSIILITSCDPVYNVGFINTSNQPILLETLITDHFQVQSFMIMTVVPGKDSTWAKFQVPPGDTILCGQTIAEIDDEMPFTQLKIFTATDSIIASDETEIKKLFNHTFFGSPYLIEVK